MKGPAHRASIRIPIEDDVTIRVIQGEIDDGMLIGNASYTDTMLLLMRLGAEAWEERKKVSCGHHRTLPFVPDDVEAKSREGVRVICLDCEQVVRRIMWLGGSEK